MDGEGTGDREMVVLIRIRSILTSSFHQLIHILGNFIIGHFGIALRGPDVRVSHHLLILSIGTPAESVKVPNECLLAW